MQPTQAFLNVDELEANGHTVEDVARYMMTFTQAQTAGGGVEPNPGEQDDVVMAGGLPLGAHAGPAVPSRGEGIGAARLPGTGGRLVYPVAIPMPSAWLWAAR